MQSDITMELLIRCHLSRGALSWALSGEAIRIQELALRGVVPAVLRLIRERY